MQAQGPGLGSSNELGRVREEVNRAVQRIRSSGGAAQLRAQPWYAIIGSQCGRSSLIRGSGLTYHADLAQQGLGGTAVLDVWPTSEALIFDPAGRLLEASGDGTWKGLLGLLRQQRPRWPLNGLILAVSVEELLASPAAYRSNLAERFKARISQTMQTLGITLPVYVVVTKCDLLPGFMDAFGSLARPERASIWGYTVPLAEQKNLAALIPRRFDELTGRLHDITVRRLAAERRIESRALAAELPMHFVTLREPLNALLSELFVAAKYGETPPLRGVFFASGAQSGYSVDRLMGPHTKMAQDVKLWEPPGDQRGFFVQSAFLDVMIPDAALVTRTRASVAFKWLWRSVVALILIALSVLCVGLAGYSWLQNRSLIGSTSEFAVEAQSRTEASSPVEFDSLRARLDELEGYAAEGAPWSYSFGLYRGDSLLPPARYAHALGMRSAVIAPIAMADARELREWGARYEADLDAQPTLDEHENAYRTLIRYLRLTTPEDHDVEPAPSDEEANHLSSEIASRWTTVIASARESGDAVRAANAIRFVSMLREHGELALPRDSEAVRLARLGLNRFSAARIAFAQTVSELDGRGYDITLTQLIRSADSDTEDTSSLVATEHVRGAYTRRAWEEHVRTRFEGGDGGALASWVLGRPLGNEQEVAARVRREARHLYFTAYIEEWLRFVRSIRVRAAANVPASIGMLEDLTRGDPPPFGRLMRGVVYNSELSDPNAPPEPPGEDHPALNVRDVRAAFDGLAQIENRPEGNASPLDAYQEQLLVMLETLRAYQADRTARGLEDRVEGVQSVVERLIQSQTVGWRPTLEVLLWPPVSVAIEEESAWPYQRLWCRQVVRPFQSTLADRYPFSRGGRDADISAVAAFYRPRGGTFWGFYEQYLRPHLSEEDADQIFRPQTPLFVRRSTQIRDTLFPNREDDPRVQLQVRVHPAGSLVSGVRFQVEGRAIEYHNGPPTWTRMIWAGIGGGASIEITGANGLHERLAFGGPWGLYHLLDHAGAVRGAGETLTATWSIEGHEVTADIQVDGGRSPFYGPGLLGPFRAAGAAPPIAATLRARGCDLDDDR